MTHESVTPQVGSEGPEATKNDPNSTIEIVPYSDTLLQEWDEFVDNSRNGTIFHKQQFLGYHPVGRFDNASLMLRKKGKLVAVFPAAWVDDEELGRVFNSYPGSSYGGPVFCPKTRTSTIESILEAIEQYVRAKGGTAIQMRLPPHVFHNPPLEELEFLLHLYGYRICRAELSNFVTLEGTNEDLLARAEPRCRRHVKKGLRHGLTHSESEDYDAYWEILEENLESRYGVRPTHTLEEMKDLAQRFPDDVKLFAVHEGTRMVAGTVVFQTTRSTAHTFYMSSRADARQVAPMNLALYSAMVTLQNLGFRAVNFGVSTPQGKSVNWGLLEFKESFGGSGVCRNTYRKCLNESELQTN